MTASALAPITSPSLAPFPHGFYGRAGGVSGGLYANLNCGLGSQDLRDAVIENRSRVAAQLGTSGARLLTCYQIHSAEVVTVEEPWAPGAQPKADGLVTRTPGLALGALAADCMPILFADAEAGVIGAAHAGWKGALGRVDLTTIAAMERLGARRARIHAVIGPCISQRSYEVSPAFRETFVKADSRFDRYFGWPVDAVVSPPSPVSAQPPPPTEHVARHPYFDLPGFMLDRLNEAGIASAQWVDVCTYANPDNCFSYRRATHLREPDYGRHIGAICIA